MALRLGIDIGSTTVKTVLLDENDNIIDSGYRRHLSDVRGGLLAVFKELADKFGDTPALVNITGSAGMSCAGWIGVPFVQEVIAATASVEKKLPETDVVIELGGEDAKITFMKPVLSQRMNGTCAGGTGAFIDQMASLLQTDVAGLNELAKGAEMIYSIASRCGVFAKSDLQPLLNDGAKKEDLAASILTAVVNQTIAGLACGQPIKGNIVFLGGPLHFLSELRSAFEKALKENATSFTLPENAHLFVALGAAYLCDGEALPINGLYERLNLHKSTEHEVERMPKLFETERDREEFFSRHEKEKIEFKPISSAKGDCFLGIDAGSTTIKAVLLNSEGEIIYNYYSSNNGSPIDAATVILKEIYSLLPEEARIASSCVTGYGEQLIRTAFRLDFGEIETLAHYKAAATFDPDVDFIIDIGGQDMKCMHIKNGIIDSITLNEACSSGCGSFIQTFAKSLGLEPAELSREALDAENPVDLGTRCTVFMNSRVKQAQKEGATVGDISAGLAYAVVRNALFKVIKLRSPEQLGNNIVVQGGTFYNNAVLRCLEIISGKKVIRPSIAGLMGAYGAAIIAKERANGEAGAIISKEELEKGVSVTTTSDICKNCSNNCKLTITEFDGGRRLISGNRCERGEGKALASEKLPNLVRYKYTRLFSYKPTPVNEAKRGVMGVPRALNMYEKYPLWFTVLTELGFSVMLSKRSDHKLFEKGMSTIPSESVCYPAKLSHGHVMDLIDRGATSIFMPCMPYEAKENEDSGNHYNCPIVTSYPEVIENNIELIRKKGIKFHKPFINTENIKTAAEVLSNELKDYNVTCKEALNALKKGIAEEEKFHADMRKKGEETVKFIHDNKIKGIVLAGRPYHVDPEINHGLPQMINTLGFAVLTEDSVSHLKKVKRPIRVVDQWVYHSRLYDAAAFTCGEENIELVQLNSFGCGLDAVTTDQVQEILEANDQIYTCLKIDEINNLGAARIRMRSLAVVLNERKGHTAEGDNGKYSHKRAIFTKEMKQNYTIIGPQMSPIHFDLIEPVALSEGYNLKLLRTATREDIEAGLRHVNNDACYPSIITVGQLVNAVENGECDPEKTALLITQTGGGCRATNYIAFLRKALRDAGYPDIPVISVNLSGLEKNPGFKFTLSLIDKVLKVLILGDAIQNMLYRMRPYEINKGDTDRTYEKWRNIIKDTFAGKRKYSYSRLMRDMVHDFDSIPIDEHTIIPKVGVVGEILVKFHPDANNHVVDVIESEGCEAVVPGLVDFFLYSLNTGVFKHRNLGLPKKSEIISKMGVWFIERYREPLRKELHASKHFEAPCDIIELSKKAERVLSLGNVCGEGWLLTAEMVELIESGAPNIVCTQPFSCLPNHVTGKGMIKELRRLYPQSNICPVDYDPGASEVNQLNRIKLMISSAKKNLTKDLEEKSSNKEKQTV